MSHQTLLIASLMFSFAAYPIYAYGIHRDGARPTRPTWLMILVTDLLLFWFMLAEARWDWLLLGFTAGNIMMLAIMAWTDIAAANRQPGHIRLGFGQMLRLAVLGRDPWSSKDIYSVIVALCALALWAATGSGITAIVFSLAGKIVASIPMWINLYREPGRERLLPWIVWTIGGTLYVASIPQADWSFTALATPILFVILELLVISLLLRKPVQVTEATPAALPVQFPATA